MGINELKNLANRISYARLLKDMKKVGLNVSRLRIPEKISGQLASARVRAMLKVVFGGVKIRVTKERYCYRWCVGIEDFEKIYQGNEYDFYKFFNAHPDVKKVESKYDFDFCSIRYFTVFEDWQRGYSDYLLEYNSNLLEEIKRYREYADAILAVYPEVKRQWAEYEKRSIQEKYDAIVAIKTRIERKQT